MWDVVGHERVVQSLQRGIAAGHLAHAYLFVGPPQIGKTTLAVRLAQAVNCAQTAPPCGVCRSCVKIERGIHPDVQFIGPAEERARHAPGQLSPEEADARRRKRVRLDLIPIDDIRAMQRSMALAPLEGRWKVALIARAERMTEEAANALLKTLEEPPAHVILALTTTDAGLLLPTIVSRCQALPLAALPRAQVEAALRERWRAPADSARLLAALAGGRLGWAVTALQDPTILAARQAHLQMLAQVLSQGRAPRLELAGELAAGFAQRRAEVLGILHTWLSWARDLWLVSLGCPEQLVNVDQEATLLAQAQQVDAAGAQTFIQALQDTLRQLDQNVNPRLALEVLMLRMP